MIPYLHNKLASDTNNKWDTFCEATKVAGISLPDDPAFNEQIKSVFGFSDFIAKSCTRNPELLNDLAKSGDLLKKYSGDEYATRLANALESAADEAELLLIITQFRNREMVRIAWRDLAGMADIFQTMADLSTFADTCIDQVLSFLYKRHCGTYGTPANNDGTPQNMVILGMGKLGGQELNFSSDVDLIFAYPASGNTTGGKDSISNEEFFTKLSRNFLKIFSDKTPNNLIFRVDMRLRPFGENGPIIMSFSALENYYQRQGREWERYALIKARVAGGDKKFGNILLERLRPFVYRRYLDYGTYDSLRDMKQKIAIEIKRKGMQNNIKLGPGGIREIEFFGQVFQLIRGGVEPDLQERRILNVLNVLISKSYIPKNVFDELVHAYIFLRNTEHRLQEYSDLQTHDLPSEHTDKIRLASSMGFDGWKTFAGQLNNHMKHVHQHFNELLATDEDDENPDNKLGAVWQGVPDREQIEQILLETGFLQSGQANQFIEYLRNDTETRALSREGRERLDKLMPLVLEKISRSPQPDLSLKRIIDLIKTIERRTCYLALILENPAVLTHLVKLSNESPWIISYLAYHPVLLDELLDTRTLYTPMEKTELEQTLHQRMERVSGNDIEQQIEELTIFKQVHTLRVAAADVGGAHRLMKVSDYLTYIAETILSEVLELTWRHLVKKHGTPVCEIDGKPCDKGFAIVAYGKLGGLELGYGSDLDLVFLHAGSKRQTEGGKIPLDSSQFYARLGQRIIHLLTAHTRAGMLYDIDMRLRPSGSAGVLVSHVDAFRGYQANEAWTWEHQALSRTRAICGDTAVKQHFENTRKETLCIPRNKEKLKQEISSMREKMRNEHKRQDQGLFDIKQGNGGIVDIEFLVQYLVLLNAHRHDEIIKWPDNIRQLESLAHTSILDKKTAVFLKSAYLTFRKEVHRLNLQEKPSVVPDEKYNDLREKIRMLWDRYLG